jgi:hypothetical protein
VKQLLTLQARLQRRLRIVQAKIATRKAAKHLRGGRLRAVQWALAQVGTIEHPPNSNTGPKITQWEKHWGAQYVGQPWCGAFVGIACIRGGAHPTSRVVYTPYIRDDAAAGRNGMEKLVRLQDVQGGDLALFDFPDSSTGIQHVAMVRHKYNGRGTIDTVEGNTSAGASGSQDNGGGVFTRTRPVQYVVAFARPRYE